MSVIRESRESPTEQQELAQAEAGARARACQMTTIETSITIYVVHDPSYHYSSYHPYRLIGPRVFTSLGYQDSSIVAKYKDGSIV